MVTKKTKTSLKPASKNTKIAKVAKKQNVVKKSTSRSIAISSKNKNAKTISKSTKASAGSRKKITKSSRHAKSDSGEQKRPNVFKRIVARVRAYRGRRPHKSFELTRRRDYMRSLKMPGYLSFTKQVFAFLRKEKKTFILLVLVMAAAQMILVGMMSQTQYQSFTDVVNQTSENVANGSFGKIFDAGMTLLTAAQTGGLNPNPTEIQQVFGVLIFIIIWLVTVWLLRQKMAGNKVRLRDGLYNACAPLMSTLLVALMLLIQVAPALIAFILYGAAVSTDFLSNPFAAVVFWIVAGSLVLISAYLAVGTLLALLVVTQPGRYPLDAVRIAGDLVVGRRVRILLRVVWSFVVMALMWIVVMIPIILFDGWIKSVVGFVYAWPIVPVTLLIVIAASVIFFSAYVYMFYRRIIDDGADPS